MNIRTILSAISGVLLLSSALHTAPVAQSTEIEIPSEMCGGYFLIPLEVDLDGDGTSTTLMALFDTGGSNLFIDPDSVVLAGGEAIEERKRITIRGATAGPLTFSKLRPRARHLDHLARLLGTEIDIFLPFRTFREQLLTLDFPQQEIRISEGRLPPPDGLEVFSAKGPDRRPWLDIDIAGRPRRLLIDSGSSGSIAVKPGDDLTWASEPLPLSAAQGMNEVVYSDVGRLDATLEIAGVSIVRPVIKVGDNTELIGTQVMRRFAWTFDQNSRSVRIRPDSQEPLHLPAKRGTGAVLIPGVESLEIVRVLEGTPAYGARLRPGDIVLATDGVRVFEQSCDRWTPGRLEKTRLTVSRNGTTFDVVLQVVDLVP
jgi:hypothetical protein